MSCQAARDRESELKGDHPPPEKLYKYRALPKSKTEELWRSGEVARTEVHYARPSTLNDPFEHLHFVDLDASKEEIAQYVRHKAVERGYEAESSWARAKIRELLQPTRWAVAWTEMADMYGHFSLSDDPGSPLMWTHYADNHRGYCLEYTIRDADIVNPGTLLEPVTERVALKVHYLQARTPVSVREFLQDRLATESKTQGDPEETALWVNAKFLTKHVDWSYEKEWRTIRKPENGGTGTLQWPQHLLTGIILGARTENSDLAMLLHWIAEREVRPIIYRAVPDPEGFRYRTERIE